MRDKRRLEQRSQASSLQLAQAVKHGSKTAETKPGKRPTSTKNTQSEVLIRGTKIIELSSPDSVQGKRSQVSFSDQKRNLKKLEKRTKTQQSQLREHE